MRDVHHSFFRGATRVATKYGVPVSVLLWAFLTVAVPASLFNVLLWLLLPVVILILRQITINDDRKFRIWSLWFETKFRNRNQAFWKGSTYGTGTLKRNPKGSGKVRRR